MSPFAAPWWEICHLGALSRRPHHRDGPRREGEREGGVCVCVWACGAQSWKHFHSVREHTSPLCSSVRAAAIFAFVSAALSDLCSLSAREDMHLCTTHAPLDGSRNKHGAQCFMWRWKTPLHTFFSSCGAHFGSKMSGVVTAKRTCLRRDDGLDCYFARVGGVGRAGDVEKLQNDG